MIPHPDVLEKLVASRHAQIQHEMQQIRMLTHVRQQSTLVRRTIGSLGGVLIILGSYLQRTDLQNDASLTLKAETPNP